MNHTLLAATDFSTPARHALERAAMLAQAHPDSTLTLAHVANRTAFESLRRLLPGDAAALEANLLADAASRLDTLARQLAAQYGRPVDTVLEQGSAAAVLPELARARQSDLVVMGARGAHFIRELLLGSTTERVLRRSQRPLLAVKQRPLTPYRRILAPVDFSAHAAVAVDTAHAWLPDADIVLLHAFEVEMESTFRLAGMSDEKINAYRQRARVEAQDAMEAFIAELRVPAQRLTREFVHGAPALHILEREQALDADLIVIGKQGQSALEEMLLGSVTRHVLAHSGGDVLITTNAGTGQIRPPLAG